MKLLSRRSRLIYKFSLLVTVVIILLIIGVSTIIVLGDKREHLARVREEGISLAQAVGAGIAHSLVRKDYAFLLEHNLHVLQTRKLLRYIIVLTRDRSSLVYTPGEWDRRTLTDSISKRMEEIREPSFVRYRSDIAKEEVFEAAVPMIIGNYTAGIVRLGLSASPYDAHRTSVYLRTVILSIVCCLFAILGAVLLTRRIVSPIERAEQLERAFKELEQAHGDLNRAHQEQERTQEELARAYERLSEHDREKSKFFDNVSHELRTPLTLILTPLERLLAEEEGRLPDRAKKRLRAMQGNTQRLLRLVNQLLDFSAIESGGTTLAFEQRDVRALLEPIIEGFGPFARSKGLRLELKAPDELPEAYVDPEKLDKIICNLLSNACKFTDTGGVLVRISADERMITITVKDTGAGIPEKELDRIFERFRQVEDKAVRAHQGTGIGLALAKELTEMMGASISVQSDVGFGSVFTVRLPLGTDHISDPTLIRSSPDEPARASATLTLEADIGTAPDTAAPQESTIDDTKPLLLIVEDNPDMRSLVADICQQDFNVIEAADGRQGLELINSRMPALVISDVMMPRMNGYELLQQVRADPATASIPMMLLTARVGPDKMIEGLESGADDYLSKPFESRELVARARNLVRLRQQEAQLRDLNARLQQEVVNQAAELERARMLGRFLPPEVARSILEGQRPVQARQQRFRLTVFKLELRGFDKLVEIIEPEDLAAMLNAYLSEMTEVAFSHGASVDKFIRDTVVGYVGAPTSGGATEDAVRCANMAIDMLQRAFDLCERWREVTDSHPPVPTMVLTSGFATVGNFGSANRLEYTAMGGPMDEADALLPAVSPGVAVCSQSTWSLVQEAVEGELWAEVSVRHRSRKVKLFRIAGTPERSATALALLPTDRVALTPSTEPADTVPQPAPVGTPDPEGESRTGELKAGMILAGRYQILRRLGEGGMGTIYLASDNKLSSEVALKLIRHELSGDPGRRARLYREVKLARLVSHVNVARIYDLGDWDSHEFISMEYIRGQTLSYRLKTSGALELESGHNVMLQLCAGLAAAHAVGIIHRDLKPSNIMLEQGGRVVILDFGIAKWASSIHRTGTDTRGAIGTPHYMAPEQFSDAPIDSRADIYALGVVAYELFTGAKPFDADSAVGIAYKHTHEPPPDPQALKPDLPPRLVAVILRCLEKAPDSRFDSVGEVASLLTKLVPGN